MATASSTIPTRSVHYVAPVWRWVCLAILLGMLAVAVFAALEVLESRLDEPGPVSGSTLFDAAAIGGFFLIFVSSLIWIRRARVTIDGDRMTVRRLFDTVTLTPDRMEGYRYLEPGHTGPELHVYVKDLKFAVDLAHYEHQDVIDAWVHARTPDLAAEALEDEDRAIAADQSLGVDEADKDSRLARLRGGIELGNYVLYAAGTAAAINFLFYEHVLVTQGLVAILLLVPLIFDLSGLLYRGHVRFDHDDGTRYPEIFTGTVASTAALLLISLFDRGAVLDRTLYFQLLGMVAAVKGLIWWVADSNRLAVVESRGGGLRAFTVLAYFAVAAVWAGGALYQINKELDESSLVWHPTEVVTSRSLSRSLTSYIEVERWDDALPSPLEITLRYGESDAFETGMAVRVGVRAGALGIPWVERVEVVPDAEAQPLAAPSPDAEAPGTEAPADAAEVQAPD